MILEACLQMLIKVNKYAESEFRIKKIYIMNIYCCCLQLSKQTW